MEDLYKHIESLGKEHGYKNMTVLCKAAGVPRSTMSELNNGRIKAKRPKICRYSGRYSG